MRGAVAYVGEHHYAVLGEVQVGFDGVSAGLDGAAEGRHGVFWEGGLVPAVGNDLRHAIDGGWMCVSILKIEAPSLAGQPCLG